MPDGVMKLKILYRKNLKMSPGKIAAQCVHAATGLHHDDYGMSVVVLAVSDKKFQDLPPGSGCFLVRDAGHTEVEPGTPTCIAYYEA
jgi:peptidyl-tRNA hydrolase